MKNESDILFDPPVCCDIIWKATFVTATPLISKVTYFARLVQIISPNVIHNITAHIRDIQNHTHICVVVSTEILSRIVPNYHTFDIFVLDCVYFVLTEEHSTRFSLCYTFLVKLRFVLQNTYFLITECLFFVS